MTIDPSAHHGDPIGEAFSHFSQKAAQFISMAGAAYETAARRKAIRAAKEAARTQQQLQAAEKQEKALREAARARWAPALNAQWLAQAGLVQAGRVWGAAAAYANDDPQAAAALRKAEERMRVPHPYAMARYDRLRYEGARPLEAMRQGHGRAGRREPETLTLELLGENSGSRRKLCHVDWLKVFVDEPILDPPRDLT
jgi:hypothetical protein